MLGSGGRGVCVCVCLAWSRSRDISLWGERTKRGEGIFKFKIKDTSVREEKSPEPPSNISGNSLSSSQRTKQAAIPLWPFLDTHFNEMSKMGDNCITHTKSRVNPIV